MQGNMTRYFLMFDELCPFIYFIDEKRIVAKLYVFYIFHRFKMRRSTLSQLFMEICFFGLFCSVTLNADESLFENSFNHFSGNSLKKVTVIGERCSGTNYISGLIKSNFPLYKTRSDEYAQKHFYPWLDLPAFSISKKGKRERDVNFLNNSKECLFIVVVRDPYNWLRSFYAQPFHVLSRKMIGKGFFHFLQHEWRAEESKHNNVSYPDHWNPYKERPFKNVLELRKYKILNYLQVGILVDNFFVVQYEKVAKNPAQFVEFMSENFHMEKNDVFENITSYKNEGKKKFQKKEYPPFEIKEFEFINQEIDWDVEKFIGYSKVESLDDVNSKR